MLPSPDDGILYRMKRANISTVRSNLSRILEAVRHGEEYEILDRNVPVARLVPIAPLDPGVKKRPRQAETPPWVERLRRAGKVRVGSLLPVPEILAGFPPGTPSLGSAAIDAIIEERGER